MSTGQYRKASLSEIRDTSPPDGPVARIVYTTVGILGMIAGPALSVCGWFIRPGWGALAITAVSLLTIPIGLMIIGVTDLKARVPRERR
jgi:multisubunit Na+/H+ antiporter MnhG subunit